MESITDDDSGRIGSMFVAKIPDSKGIIAIQKFYTSYTVMADSSYIEYVLIKISYDWQILCKLIPQLLAPSTFGCCDVSVLKRTSNKFIHPLTVKLDKIIDKHDIKPIRVANAKHIIVSIVFKEVEHQNIWSKNQNKLAEAIRHLLRLFVVHNDCIVSFKRIGSNQNFNIDLILVHKTDCNNDGARITSETSIIILETISTIQYNHVKIGLEVEPLFGMELPASRLEAIIKAARNGCTPLCNMVGVHGSCTSSYFPNSNMHRLCTFTY